MLNEGEILEEVRPLRRTDAVVGQPGLHDRAGTRDLIPAHRDAQPRIGRAPASDTDEQIRRGRIAKLGIEPADVRGGFAASRAVEPLDVHHHHVADVRDRAVPQHGLAVAEQTVAVHARKVNRLDLTIEGEGADLQEAELPLAASVRREIHGELDLDGSGHTLPAQRQQLVEDSRQRKRALLENGGEGDDACTGSRDAVEEGVVLRRIGRCERRQRAIRLGGVEPESCLAQVSERTIRGVREFECPKEALRVLEALVDSPRTVGCAGDGAARSAGSSRHPPRFFRAPERPQRSRPPRRGAASGTRCATAPRPQTRGRTGCRAVSPPAAAGSRPSSPPPAGTASL